MLKQGMKPEHPGLVLKTMYIKPLGLSQAECADNLKVSRKTLAMLLNGHQGISAEMALRLAKVFNTSPELWLNMQSNYDLWSAGKKVKVSQIKAYKPVVVALQRVSVKEQDVLRSTASKITGTVRKKLYSHTSSKA